MEDASGKDEPLAKHAEGKRVFIPTIGSFGDVKPYLILAKELKKQGYIVRLGVHKRFELEVQQNGLETVDIGGDMEIALTTTPDGIALQRNPSLFQMGLVKRVFLPLVEEWFNGVVEGLKGADLIVLSITSLLVGLACLEKYPGVKVVGIYTYPCRPTSELSPPGLGGKSTSLFNWINTLKWKLFELGAASMYSDKINELRANLRLPPIKLNYDEMVRLVLKKPISAATIYSSGLVARPRDWLTSDLLVGPILSEEDQADFQPAPDLQEFLNQWQTERIIYIGIGSMMGMMFGEREQFQFLMSIQAALRRTHCKAVVSLVGFQNIPVDKLSDCKNVFYLRESIPHTWLFPKMSAVIHHGGAGTTHTGLRYALPTLVLPFGADQPFNGDRISMNQLGPKALPIRQMNTENLTKAIEDLMNNYTVYRDHAKKVSQLIQEENGLRRCVELIEREFNS